MLRILHTGDWHLGAQLDRVSREQEHLFFLDWLLDYFERESIDVLVIAGDVFHHAQPSAEALALYYGFLAKLAKTRLRQIVIIGGNHDSAARLDAPNLILSELNIHVVGGLTADERSWERCVCPVFGEDPETPQAVFLAVPFIHEYRLGIRTTARSPQDISKDMHAAFSRIYTKVSDLARGRWPGAPLVALGHLTCGSELGSPEVAVHQMDSIGGLSPNIFDERITYVALGHLHQMCGPRLDQTWYSGSPIPINITEAATSCYVMKVVLGGPPPKNEDYSALRHGAYLSRVKLPTWRQLMRVEGSLEALVVALKKLAWKEPLPPLVYPVIEVERYQPGIEAELHKALKDFPAKERPRLVRCQQNASISAEEALLHKQETPPLKELTPEEVFLIMYHQRYQEEPRPAILSAFRSLVDGVIRDEQHT